MKTYTNSKGESLPKVICAVVEFEHERLGSYVNGEDEDTINDAFDWFSSNIFGKDSKTNAEIWNKIDDGQYQMFYSIFQTCKNSRGQELPEDIQVEIVEERLRQGTKEFWMWLFDWSNSTKGYVYWHDVSNSDYSTKSDDTFTQWEIVEVSDREDFSKKYTGEIYLCFFNGLHWTISKEANKVAHSWKYCRKPTLELTLPELLTIAEEVKGTKVKLKS